MFRYGGTEKFLGLGYTPTDLKEIGDWGSSYMPEKYAERKGLTRTQRRFMEAKYRRHNAKIKRKIFVKSLVFMCKLLWDSPVQRNFTLIS